MLFTLCGAHVLITGPCDSARCFRARHLRCSHLWSAFVSVVGCSASRNVQLRVEALDAASSAGSFGVSPAGSADGSILAKKSTWGVGVATRVRYGGPPMPFAQLTSSASEKFPRWSRNPCNNARKALEVAPLSKEAVCPRRALCRPA